MCENQIRCRTLAPMIKMCPLLSNLYGSLNRSFKMKKNRVRCISIKEFLDSDEIELEMEYNSLIMIFFREFRMKKPVDAKRFLQRLNVFIRQYEYEILNLGKLDYFFLLPKNFEISTNNLFPSI